MERGDGLEGLGHCWIELSSGGAAERGKGPSGLMTGAEGFTG